MTLMILSASLYGTEQGGLTSSDTTNIVKIRFGCRPGAIAQPLAFREPKYVPYSTLQYLIVPYNIL